MGRDTAGGKIVAIHAARRDREIFKDLTLSTGKISRNSAGSIARSFNARAWTFAQVKGLDTFVPDRGTGKDFVFIMLLCLAFIKYRLIRKYRTAALSPLLNTVTYSEEKYYKERQPPMSYLGIKKPSKYCEHYPLLFGSISTVFSFCKYGKYFEKNILFFSKLFLILKRRYYSIFYVDVFIWINPLFMYTPFSFCNIYFIRFSTYFLTFISSYTDL